MCFNDQSIFIFKKAFLHVSIACALTGCHSQKDRLNNEARGVVVSKRPFPVASGNSAENASSIKIGLITAESGQLSPWGLEIEQAVKLAIETFNQTSSIKGKKIELVIGDSASKPEAGKSAAEKMISDGVIGILGDLTSGITAQIAKATFEKGIPQISIGGTKNDLTDIGANIFRICYTDDFQGRVMADFAYKELNLKKVAIFTDKNQPYSVGLTEGFKQHFQRQGGKIADQQFYESGQTDFSAQLTNVKGKRPDGLFIAGYYPEVGPIVRQAHNMGIDVPRLGGDGWDNDELLTSGGTSIIGSYFCTHYDEHEKREAVKNFQKQWQKVYQTQPKMIASALAYDSAFLMIDALKRSKKLDSISLLKAIENTQDFPCVTGDVTFRAMKGNSKKRAVVVKLTPKGRRFQKEYSYSSILK
jgi:branched-chain amino acid transport system substrate-binding protein